MPSSAELIYDAYSTSSESQLTGPPETRMVSLADHGPRRRLADGPLWGAFGGVVVEPDVDRKRSGDGNPSYVSGPELGWRGTGRGRPTGPLLQRRKPYYHCMVIAWEEG